MNLNKKKILFIGVLISSITLFSCSNDDTEPSEIPSTNKGRFDNIPFKWDETLLGGSESRIFIGDISAEGDDSADGVKTKSGYNDNNIDIINPNGIYVGAAYPASSFGTTFDKEITEPRNPIDLIFDFKDPYIDEVTKETGSVGYKLALKRAIKSDEHKSQANASKPTVDYSMTEYSSYSDVEKSFSASSKFGFIFTAKMKANYSSSKINVKGRLLARMTSTNFNVYMDTPPSSTGFFKDPSRGSGSSSSSTRPNYSSTSKSTSVIVSSGRTNIDYPVYLKSLTYGKVVYMSIESEYSYSEVKKAFQTSFSMGFKVNMKGSEEVTKVFEKSVITIFIIDDNSNGYSFYDIDKIGELNSLLFETNYDEISYGFPIFCEGRYVYNNALFKPSDNNDNASSSDDRPSYNSGSSSSGTSTTRPSSDTGDRGSSSTTRPSYSSSSSSTTGGATNSTRPTYTSK